MKTLLIAALLAAVVPAAPIATPAPLARPSALTRPTPVARNTVHVTFGPDATVEGYTAWFISNVAGFTVDATKLHVDRAALDGTVLARDVSTVAAAPAAQMGPPGPAQIVRVALSVPRAALQPGMQSLLLRTDDGAARRDGNPVTLGANRVSSLAHVDVPDPSGDEALRRRFAGIPVYGYGPLALTCGVVTIPYATVITQPHTELRIARIERTQGAAILHAGYDSSDQAFTFKAIDPLRIIFDPAVRLRTGGASFSYPSPPRAAVGPTASGSPQSTGAPISGSPQATAAPMTPAPMLTRAEIARQHERTKAVMQEIAAGCRSLQTSAAGAWHLERMVTTVAPPPGLTRVRLGFTHEQVALIDGFPSVYATKAELMRMPEWIYDRPAPFSSFVAFDGDRVVKYQPPGNLP